MHTINRNNYRQIANDLVTTVFAPISKQEDEKIEAIADKNDAIRKEKKGAEPTKCFLYDGEAYFAEFPKVNLDNGVPDLDKSLIEEVNQFNVWYNARNEQEKEMYQFFANVFKAYLRETDEVPLGKCIPNKILSLTEYEYNSGDFDQIASTDALWNKMNPKINKLLALRMLL